MASRQYDEATKAAVMAALLAGQSINSAAKEYNIPVGTIKYWRAKNETFNTVDPQKRDEIGQRLHSYLLASLDALKAQTMVFADETWLRKQPANELAVLHGVIADKGIRLLEAIAPEVTEDEEE
jgi:transposase-like protein